MIKDENKNPEAIGIENVKEIGDDKVNGPILLAIILLMGIGPLLPWRKSRFKILFNVLKVPLFFAFVLVVILLFLGVMNPLALFAFAICSLSVTGIFYEWVKGTRVRHGHGENWVVAYMRLLLGNRPRYGGYIIHLGIVMLAIGIIGSSFYDFQKDVTNIQESIEDEISVDREEHKEKNQKNNNES